MPGASEKHSTSLIAFSVMEIEFADSPWIWTCCLRYIVLHDIVFSALIILLAKCKVHVHYLYSFVASYFVFHFTDVINHYLFTTLKWHINVHIYW